MEAIRSTGPCDSSSGEVSFSGRETAIFHRLMHLSDPFGEFTAEAIEKGIRRAPASAKQTVTMEQLEQMGGAERYAFEPDRIRSMQRIVSRTHHQCVGCINHLPIEQLERTPLRDRCDDCCGAEKVTD